MGYVLVLIYVASVVWVAVDAGRHDWSQRRRGAKTAAGQVIGVVILWIVFFPLYLVQRRQVPRIGRRIALGTKKCPDCAEVVLAEALVCKHCGRRFDSSTTGAAS